jgi:hypothetical protein
MQLTREMPAVPWRSRSDLYVPITCAKMRKASHAGNRPRMACLTLQHQHEFEAQREGASAVCICDLQVEYIAAE